MRLVRFRDPSGRTKVGVWTPDDTVVDVTAVNPTVFSDWTSAARVAKAEGISLLRLVERAVSDRRAQRFNLQHVTLLIPVEAPEVWAAGVTYARSREARNAEVREKMSVTVYDKVYEAERPELFLKATALRTVGPGESVCIRSDSAWQVPEPELGLVLTAEGEILGYTIGNDMSCRDIEGENPLYLPQAKIWKSSCAIGPAILLADAVAQDHAFTIVCRIYRSAQVVFQGSASTRQMKRTFGELIHYLLRDNVISDGTVLLTGTCIVPPDDFTLQEGDRIEIEVPEIGTLINPVARASMCAASGIGARSG